MSEKIPKILPIL